MKKIGQTQKLREIATELFLFQQLKEIGGRDNIWLILVSLSFFKDSEGYFKFPLSRMGLVKDT